MRNNILLTSNNLVEWLQSEVVYDENAVAAVGKKYQLLKNQKKDTVIQIFIYMLVIVHTVKTQVQNL